jgi:lipoprotein-anchoring transpeptidase ErfK/SrfK
MLVGSAGCGGVRQVGDGAVADRPRSRTAAESIVATASTPHVQVYRSPQASRPFLSLSNPTAEGAPLVFLVRQQQGGWSRVYLPVRPNESTGWIRDRALRFASNPFSLHARLRHHELILLKHGRRVARFPAAVGRSVLPTPTGRYFIVALLKQPDPHGSYGPYAFGLSAYSKVLYSFGGGPGQIGIHGTNDATSIGQSASHGCIRIPNADVTRLALQLPLGTPVTITP